MQEHPSNCRCSLCRRLCRLLEHTQHDKHAPARLFFLIYCTANENEVLSTRRSWSFSASDVHHCFSQKEHNHVPSYLQIHINTAGKQSRNDNFVCSADRILFWGVWKHTNTLQYHTLFCCRSNRLNFSEKSNKGNAYYRSTWTISTILLSLSSNSTVETLSFFLLHVNPFVPRHHWKIERARNFDSIRSFNPAVDERDAISDQEDWLLCVNNGNRLFGWFVRSPMYDVNCMLHT